MESEETEKNKVIINLWKTKVGLTAQMVKLWIM